MAKYTKPDYSEQLAGAGVTLQGNLTFSSYLNQDVFTVNIGLDMSAAFLM